MYVSVGATWLSSVVAKVLVHGCYVVITVFKVVAKMLLSGWRLC